MLFKVTENAAAEPVDLAFRESTYCPEVLINTVASAWDFKVDCADALYQVEAASAVANPVTFVIEARARRVTSTW